MLAAIPFFQLEVYYLDLGFTTLPIDPWATLVCIGFVVGLEVARWRGIQLGLDTRDVVDGAVFIVLMGFVVAHVVTVLFYFPERLAEDGIMSLLRVWEGFSSTGGFIGAVLGAWIFYTYIRPHAGAMRHADVITFGFPFGWFFGRLGCTVVHDHIGSVTTFPLAMDFDNGFGPWAEGAAYASGIRHELGMYEAAYMLVVCALFWTWGKRDRAPGFFLAWFAILYAPVRFVLEFLRNTDLAHQDARYLGLTPAQYGMVAMLAAGLWLLRAIDDDSYEGVPLGARPASEPSSPEPAGEE